MSRAKVLTDCTANGWNVDYQFKLDGDHGMPEAADLVNLEIQKIKKAPVFE
jgi:hypothetical protein